MAGVWQRESNGDMELYPAQDDTYADSVASNEIDADRYIIGNYTCKDVGVVSLVKEIECTKANAEAIVYNENGRDLHIDSIVQNVRYKFAPSTVLYNINNKLKGNFGTLIGAILGILCMLSAFNISLSYTDKLSFAMFIGLAAVCLGGCLFGFFKALLKCYVYGLKTYGFNYKDETVYVINNKKETVEQAVIKSVCIANSTFGDTVFTCDINGLDVDIRGDDIYFSYGDAFCVMRGVVEINEAEITYYYPDWKTDTQFVSYYKNALPAYGFSREKAETNETNALWVPSAIINGRKYVNYHTVQELLQRYLRYLKNQKENAQQRQRVIDELQTFREKI